MYKGRIKDFAGIYFFRGLVIYTVTRALLAFLIPAPVFVSRVCLPVCLAGLSTGCAAWQRAAWQFTGLSVHQLGNRLHAWTSFILRWGDASCDLIIEPTSCDPVMRPGYVASILTPCIDKLIPWPILWYKEKAKIYEKRCWHAIMHSCNLFVSQANCWAKTKLKP